MNVESFVRPKERVLSVLHVCPNEHVTFLLKNVEYLSTSCAGKKIVCVNTMEEQVLHLQRRVLFKQSF